MARPGIELLNSRLRGEHLNHEATATSHSLITNLWYLCWAVTVTLAKLERQVRLAQTTALAALFVLSSNVKKKSRLLNNIIVLKRDSKLLNSTSSVCGFESMATAPGYKWQLLQGTKSSYKWFRVISQPGTCICISSAIIKIPMPLWQINDTCLATTLP